VTISLFQVPLSADAACPQLWRASRQLKPKANDFAFSGGKETVG
jgi:hypothetical protein